MEADLLRVSKPSSGPGKMTVKGPGKCDSLGGVKAAGKPPVPVKGNKEILLLVSQPGRKRAGGIFVLGREEQEGDLFPNPLFLVPFGERYPAPVLALGRCLAWPLVVL